MKKLHSLVVLAGSCACLMMVVAGGCDKKAPAPTPVAGSGGAHDHDHPTGDGHDHGDDHDHTDDHDHGAGHAHGATTQLGEQVVGGVKIRASCDGEIKAGGDAPIDVWIAAADSKIAAVRFWIGTRDARGSVKARAELEKDNWHTHVEVPSPLPEASKLWVEVETDAGKKFVAGFDLRVS